MAPGNEGMNMPIPYPQGHRQSPWQIHIGIKMVRRMNGADTLYPSYGGRAKKGQSQPLNYSQMTVVPDEHPLTFLQHLKDTIRKHTTVDPESQVGEIFLKDKFLTQSAPDIHRKLQKSVAEREKSLDQLMQLDMSVYYNWDVTKKKEKDKRHHDLITALRECTT
jgi:hypothetical protein